MSVEAISWALSKKAGSAGAKLVLVALANYTDGNGATWPSLGKIARQTEMSIDSVRRRIKELCDLGIIEREECLDDNGRQTTNIYILDIPGRVATCKGGVAALRGGRVATVPPPNRNHHKEPSSSLRSEDKHTPREHLLTVLDAERAEAVIDHRKRKRAPLTPRAAKLLASKFAKCPDPNAAADAMIVNGWQGFEPEWMENRNGNRSRAAHSGQPDKRSPHDTLIAGMARTLADSDADGGEDGDSAAWGGADDRTLPGGSGAGEGAGRCIDADAVEIEGGGGDEPASGLSGAGDERGGGTDPGQGVRGCAGGSSGLVGGTGSPEMAAGRSGRHEPGLCAKPAAIACPGAGSNATGGGAALPADPPSGSGGRRSAIVC